ncbi:hypothetical protein HHK36_013788 [Tetracentron sinense]|uniref:Uncharacterized protein n=1 Tax=Tetracentron sinense TaxID=13715 RepID=A0A834Z4S5_TETSI|nr:hypothetical protein HHK36_013788 [Tetracentron sinense]
MAWRGGLQAEEWVAQACLKPTGGGCMEKQKPVGVGTRIADTPNALKTMGVGNPNADTIGLHRLEDRFGSVHNNCSRDNSSKGNALSKNSTPSSRLHRLVKLYPRFCIYKEKRLQRRWKQFNTREWRRKRCIMPEESLAVFEEINDPAIGETRFSENLFLQRNEAYFGDMGVHGTGIVERERSAIPLAELFPRKIDEDMDHDSKVQREGMHKKPEEYQVRDFNSYWEQIKQLDKGVKMLSSSIDVERRVEAPLLDPTRGFIGSKFNWGGMFSCSSSQAAHPVNLLETEAIRNAIHSSSVHDILKFPQFLENHKHCRPQEKERKKLIVEGENRLGKPDSVPHGNIEYYIRDEADWLKKVLLYTHHKNKLSKPRDGVTVGCHLALVGPAISDAPSQAVQQPNKRLELLVDDRRIMKKEVTDRGGRGIEAC